MGKPWWERLFNRIKQYVMPVTVTVTAAALTALVVWVYLPVLQAEAAEVRAAIAKPTSESSPGLRSLAALAHQLFFVEAILICEILLIGTIAILLVRFVFYIIRLVAIEYKRTMRTLRTRSRSVSRPRVTESKPMAVPQSDREAKAQGQLRMGTPLEKRMYLIPGPEKIRDPRKPAKDGADAKDSKAK